MFHGAKLPNPLPASAYDDYVQILSEEMESYGKPTMLFHGDTHLFRIDKPLFSAKTKRPFENFTRAETFGWPIPTGSMSMSIRPNRSCSPVRRRSCLGTDCTICEMFARFDVSHHRASGPQAFCHASMPPWIWQAPVMPASCAACTAMAERSPNAQ